MSRLTHHRTCSEPGCSITFYTGRLVVGGNGRYCDTHNAEHYPLPSCHWCGGQPFIRVATLKADGEEFCGIKCLDNYWEYCRQLKEMTSGLQ